MRSGAKGGFSHASAARASRETTQINGIREFLPGDRLSRIHWGATAKTGQWKSKEFEREALPRTIVLLDACRKGDAGAGAASRLPCPPRRRCWSMGSRGAPLWGCGSHPPLQLRCRPGAAGISWSGRWSCSPWPTIGVPGSGRRWPVRSRCWRPARSSYSSAMRRRMRSAERCAGCPV